MIKTAGPLVVMTKACESVPASVFALNGWGWIDDILLEVVAGPKIVPRIGLQ